MKSIITLTFIALIVHQRQTIAEDNSTLDIPYIERKGVDPARISLDIHPASRKDPANGPHPVMILIHGGGWRMGDKQNAGFLQPKTSWLNQLGFDVVSINYRLSPAVQHPAHIDDVAAAIAWVQKPSYH
jgi:arylformamidase